MVFNSVTCESAAAIVTIAFSPSVASFCAVSRLVPSESKLLLSESTVNVSLGALRVVSDGSVAGEFSCPYTDIPENTVKNNKMLGKKTTTDLKFDNEYYFCSNSKLAQN
ncbi:hypothetical protein GCM10011386_30710 [Parapedobacter defluvii]|uniref:Uncharacterized protein n=1 Tax=Parapedobacter defluvii TaxID=2045106 RepID=A0ABQ1MBB6_9SPHI|nr:hypothetical protein GCM10011386_30710 [Parapedobacter defluvii]